MATWLISRHPGTLQWVQQQGLTFDHHQPHLNPADVQTGDSVYGTLPVSLIASINARGARYFHLEMDLPANKRGTELTPQDLVELGAHWQEYRAERG